MKKHFVLCIAVLLALLCLPVFAFADTAQGGDGAVCTVSYDANGGAGAPDEQIKMPGETLLLSAMVPVRDGYKFMGWGITLDGQAVYQPEGEYTDENSVTLYAVWCLFCSTCDGEGVIEKSKTCTQCGGDKYYDGYVRCTACVSGVVMVSERRKCYKCYDVWQAINPSCTVCGGSGYLYTSYGVTCQKCGGDTLIPSSYIYCNECVGGLMYYTVSCTKCSKTGVLCNSGHTVVKESEIAPTCTGCGWTEGSYCAACELVFYGRELIPPTGHTEITDPAVESTCTETGMSEGRHCSVCGAITKAQSVVQALGHSFGAYTAKDEATYYEDATQIAYCAACGEQDVRSVLGTKLSPTGIELTMLPNVRSYTKNQKINLTGIQIRATYEDGGSATFSAEDVETVDVDMTSVGIKIAKVSYMGSTATFEVYVHDGGDTEIVPQENYPESAHNYGCNLNETKTFTWDGAEKLEITFSTKTYVEYHYDYIYLYDGANNLLGSYTGSNAAGQTVSVPGDTFRIKLKTDGGVVAWGYAFSKIVATMEMVHPEVKDAATVTCCASGWTEGSHCSICGEVLVQQEYSKALGHSFTNYADNNDATCTDDGTKTSKCDRCEETDTQTVADSKLGHSFTDYKSNNDATCLKDGTKTAKCDRCEVMDTQADTDSKLVHSFTCYVYNNDATDEKDGTETACCDNGCGETDTRIAEGTMLVKEAWVQEEDKWFYYDNGSKVVGWLELDGVWYYIQVKSGRVTGWLQYGPVWYYFNQDGDMRTGWLTYGGQNYYFDTTQTNYGRMVVNKWIQDSGNWYYFDGNGHMVTGVYTINGVKHLFSASGVWQGEVQTQKTGWVQDAGKWYYYYNGVMKNGWLLYGKDWYYLKQDGSMQTGWLLYGKIWYYMDANGVMVTGSRTIGGKVYNFDANGVCLNP